MQAIKSFLNLLFCKFFQIKVRNIKLCELIKALNVGVDCILKGQRN